MGDGLISGDLHVGLNELDQPMLVDSIEANTRHPNSLITCFWKMCAVV